MIGLDGMINMLSARHSSGNDAFRFIKLLTSQGDAFAGIGKSCFVFPLGVLGDIESAGETAAGIGTVFTAVADKGSFQEPGANLIRLNKPVGMSLAVKLHFLGDGGRILVDPAGDGLESHAFGEAFLNLKAIVESKMLVLFGRRIDFSHGRWPPFWDTFPKLTSTAKSFSM